nr:reverse transcriptase domain-containing protein [Tanacetum cinerariifolium]
MLLTTKSDFQKIYEAKKVLKSGPINGKTLVMSTLYYTHSVSIMFNRSSMISCEPVGSRSWSSSNRNWRNNTRMRIEELVKHWLEQDIPIIFGWWYIRSRTPLALPWERIPRLDSGVRFASSNNEAEYEALIAGLRIAAQMGVQNVHKKVTTVVEEDGPTWMTSIVEYLNEGTLPSDRNEARKLRIKARQYELLEGILYRRLFLTPWLRYIRPLQAEYVKREIHEGSCSMHAGPCWPFPGRTRPEGQGQEAVAHEVPPSENMMTTRVSHEASQTKGIAATGPHVIKERRKRGRDRVDTNAPQKVLRRDHVDSRLLQSTHGGKSLAAMGLGMGSTCPVHASQSAPVDANPQSLHTTDVTQ